MHILTPLIVIIGFAFVVCVGLVQVVSDLSQMSFHESPVIREASRELEAAEDAKVDQLGESRATELCDAH